MAKKSNKTEHVLKLITKNDEKASDDVFFAIEQEIAENGALAIKGAEQAERKESRDNAMKEPEDEAKKIDDAQDLNADIPELKKEAAKVPEQGSELVNIAEALAREKIALVMGRMKVCTCETCTNDVLALTLNSLPTKYVTTDVGKQYFQRDEYKRQYETDILAALTKACVRVKAAPRH